MATFILFSLSCYSTKNRRIQTVSVQKRKNIAILGLEKKSGEIIEFSKENPGRIRNDKIIGTIERVTKEKIDERGNISEFSTRDGKIYKVLTGSIHEEKDKFIFTATKTSRESISIPLSDVYLIKVVEFNARTSFLVIAGILALSGLSILLLFSALAGAAG